MQYNVIGLMSGSSLDGLDIAFVQFEETAGKWQFELAETACIPIPRHWRKNLSSSDQSVSKGLPFASYGLWSLSGKLCQ